MNVIFILFVMFTCSLRLHLFLQSSNPGRATLNIGFITVIELVVHIVIKKFPYYDNLKRFLYDKHSVIVIFVFFL